MQEQTTGLAETKKTLRKLVYAGLAGGMVGVCLSATAHGNASPGPRASEALSWQADDFVVVNNADTAPSETE